MPAARPQPTNSSAPPRPFYFGEVCFIAPEIDLRTVLRCMFDLRVSTAVGISFYLIKPTLLSPETRIMHFYQNCFCLGTIVWFFFFFFRFSGTFGIYWVFWLVSDDKSMVSIKVRIYFNGNWRKYKSENKVQLVLGPRKPFVTTGWNLHAE